MRHTAEAAFQEGRRSQTGVWGTRSELRHPEPKPGTAPMMVDHTGQIGWCFRVREIPPRLCDSG